MNLDGTCQLEFRSFKRRRGLGLSFYKHLTPDGVILLPVWFVATALI